MFSFNNFPKKSLFIWPILSLLIFLTPNSAFSYEEMSQKEQEEEMPKFTLEESVEKLHSDKKEDKIKALDSLYMRGHNINADALSGVMEAAEMSDPEVKLKAINTLGNIGQDAKRSTPILMEMLGDSDENVRKSAADALKRIGSKRGIEAAEEVSPTQKERRTKRRKSE